MAYEVKRGEDEKTFLKLVNKAAVSGKLNALIDGIKNDKKSLKVVAAAILENMYKGSDERVKNLIGAITYAGVSGKVLSQAGEMLRDDKVLDSVEKGDFSILDMKGAEKLKNSHEFMLRAVARNPEVLEKAPPEFLNDPVFMRDAAIADVNAFQYMDVELKNNPTYMMATIVQLKNENALMQVTQFYALAEILMVDEDIKQHYFNGSAPATKEELFDGIFRMAKLEDLSEGVSQVMADATGSPVTDDRKEYRDYDMATKLPGEQTIDDPTIDNSLNPILPDPLDMTKKLFKGTVKTVTDLRADANNPNSSLFKKMKIAALGMIVGPAAVAVATKNRSRAHNIAATVNHIISP